MDTRQGCVGDLARFVMDDQVCGGRLVVGWRELLTRLVVVSVLSTFRFALGMTRSSP